MQLKVTKPLDELKLAAAIRIDNIAGETRLKYITEVPGQNATYTAKLEDAKLFVAAGYPADATPYVWVNMEATKTGLSATVVADRIIYTANLWATVGAQIEGERIAAKSVISSATTVLDIYNAEEVFKSAIALL